MNEIIQILMRRDELTWEEAKQAYLDCKSELEDALYGCSICEAEDILLNELGLEMDYLGCFVD